VAVGGVAAGGALVGVGVLVAHVALVGALVSIAAVPAAAGLAIGYAVARSHRQVLERTQLALERILDRLEHGDLRRRP
jgi:positive regulator of sigma E activity